MFPCGWFRAPSVGLVEYTNFPKSWHFSHSKLVDSELLNSIWKEEAAIAFGPASIRGLRSILA